jgi:hypothetical protein
MMATLLHSDRIHSREQALILSDDPAWRRIR